MDELLIRILTRLVRVHDELGKASFENAANRVLVTIARSVQLDAESRVGIGERDLGERVVRFPRPSSRTSSGDGTAA